MDERTIETTTNGSHQRCGGADDLETQTGTEQSAVVLSSTALSCAEKAQGARRKDQTAAAAAVKWTLWSSESQLPLHGHPVHMMTTAAQPDLRCPNCAPGGAATRICPMPSISGPLYLAHSSLCSLAWPVSDLPKVLGEGIQISTRLPHVFENVSLPTG